MVTEDIAQRVTSYMKHQAQKSHDAIADLVRTSQGRYLDVVSGLDDEVAARKPAPDEWSVRELTRHVISAENGVVDFVHYMSRGEQVPPGGGPRRPGLMIDDDDRPFAAYVDQLRETNEAMLKAIAELPEKPNTELTAAHPFFGELNALEWAVFQRVHDEDHVQHAQKILKATA